MKFTRQFCGGILVGVGFGLILGAMIVEQVAVDHKVLTGVSVLLVVVGVFLANKA